MLGKDLKEVSIAEKEEKAYAKLRLGKAHAKPRGVCHILRRARRSAGKSWKESNNRDRESDRIRKAMGPSLCTAFGRT